ncbi:c-type cytochrome domain-containing protein [Runella salmonicolor]|uniref:Chitobiase/beta-hexosaminidase C-terminal domain-containing protein n=1 Tax=Runella salmonicolor TaxID=2950278 RepID=A0ABT1FV98_9BACT|nr:c-type cytochrome domain-containing protein [Runella salmonicolor]MCP1385684.1 chitobiase/beta-hexosaminidase C-terminal domain-containing protein [Runella salmonicolor]
MNKKFKDIAEQALIVSTIFILFLLLFESKLVVPVWLQPVGRMHPLFLHFPIVLLLLALGMEFFRFNPANTANTFYRTFLTNFWLIGALSAAFTVIMGIFLSKETGYEGETLPWHKWTGIAVFFLAAIGYWCRSMAWYQAPVAKGLALVTTLCVVLAGHYGSVLTHGDNFITGPILKSAPVPLEEAIVFNDVIQPIFEQKCVSCHNPDKLKGELMLTDAKSILKGGKTGKLFVAGQPEISLLLQRIHLPSEDKKHMPPIGKSQLNPQEIALLSLWIKAKADFTKKVIDLPLNDSLRLIASTFLSPVEREEEQFDFAAADEETIQKLTTEFRSIAPLARESPALAVNFFNKTAFNSEKIKELKEIKEQVVFLNLAKMPVKDADISQITAFENLQKLDLNFTDITGKGLKELTSLKQLKNLSISGTKVTMKDLQAVIPNFKSLNTIVVWNTGLTIEEIRQLQKSHPRIRFIEGFKDDGKNPIKLNPPQVKNKSTVFNEPVLVQLAHPVKGVQIRFTTDGTEPDSVKSAIFTNQTVIKASTNIRAKAYKEGWFGSDEVVFDFFKRTYVPDSVRLLLPLNRVHQAEGAKSFFDQKLGTFNANSPAWANNWAGVRNNDLALMAEFKKPILLSSVELRIMEETETGIFPPESIEVWGGNSPDQLKKIAVIKPSIPTKYRTHLLQAVGGKFKPQTVSYLKIVAKPLSKMPEWHGGKGKPALLLVDEMFFN